MKYERAFVFEISDVLICAQEYMLPERVFFRFPTFGSAHKSHMIYESACFEISDVVLRTGVPEFLEVYCFEISDVLFCPQESRSV